MPYKYKSPARASSEWIPSAIELKGAGIKFVMKEVSECFLDITFNGGVLEIPPLRVYDYLNSLFRNLIVYEQCFPDVGKYVTNYATFMQCTIATAEDAKLLDSQEILVNRLGTSQAVVDLFSRRSNHLHYAANGSYLADVFTEAGKYHESEWRKWRSGLVCSCFRNRWTGTAVLFSVLLLLLLIEQSLFAALSYFRPPYGG